MYHQDDTLTVKLPTVYQSTPKTTNSERKPYFRRAQNNLTPFPRNSSTSILQSRGTKQTKNKKWPFTTTWKTHHSYPIAFSCPNRNVISTCLAIFLSCLILTSSKMPVLYKPQYIYPFNFHIQHSKQDSSFLPYLGQQWGCLTCALG